MAEVALTLADDAVGSRCACQLHMRKSQLAAVVVITCLGSLESKIWA